MVSLPLLIVLKLAHFICLLISWRSSGSSSFLCVFFPSLFCVRNTLIRQSFLFLLKFFYIDSEFIHINQTILIRIHTLEYFFKLMFVSINGVSGNPQYSMRHFVFSHMNYQLSSRKRSIAILVDSIKHFYDLLLIKLRNCCNRHLTWTACIDTITCLFTSWGFQAFV